MTEGLKTRQGYGRARQDRAPTMGPATSAQTGMNPPPMGWRVLFFCWILVLVAMVPLGAAVPDDRAIPPEAAPAFDRGFAAAGRGDWAEAIQQFSAADEVAPGTPVILFNLGLACAKTGREPAAIAWWQAYLVAAHDPAKADEVRRQIQALETAVMVKCGSIFAHALTEARHLPEPADQHYPLFRIANFLAHAGNIEAALRILGELSSRRLGTEDGDDECWRLYFTALSESGNAENMVRSLGRLPSAIDRDTLLEEQVSALTDAGQFDSAILLAAKIGDSDRRVQADSHAQSGQQHEDVSTGDLAPADIKSAVVEAWTKLARRTTAYPELSHQMDHLLQDEYLVTGAVNIKRTLRDIPVQVAMVAESEVGEIQRIRGRRQAEVERANHLNTLGYWKSLDREYAAAIAWYDRALALNPYGAYEVWLRRAEANRQAGDTAGAISDYGTALALNPRYVEAFVGRGNLKRKSGDLDGAIDDYAAAVAADPACAVAYYNRGLTAYEKGDYDLALQDSTKAIACSPNDPDAYNMRGAVRQNQGNKEEALADFDRAIELDPKHVIAYSNRASLKSARGDLGGALADFDRAITLNPGDAVLFYRRGVLKTAQKDYAGAIADFDRALAIDQDFVDARSKRAYAKGQKEDDNGAMDDYIAAAETRWSRGDLDGALDDLEWADGLDSTHAEAHFLKGKVEQALGKYEEAVGDYDVAIQYGGDEDFVVWAHLYRHCVLLRLGRTDDGLAGIVAKWENGWEKTAGLFLTGRVTESKLLAAAAAEPDAILARAQQCEAYYYAGMVRLAAQDRKAARALFEKSVATNMPDVHEYEFADSELARMDGPRTSATK